MALLSELKKLKVGYPLIIMATDARGYTHDLRATFQGLTDKHVKIQYEGTVVPHVAGKVDSRCLPRQVIIKHLSASSACPFSPCTACLTAEEEAGI